MKQNKNRLIDLLVGNISNAILHRILEKAIDNPEISNKYLTEIENSWEISKKYREKINPVDRCLPEKDVEEIRKKVINKVKAELQIRIAHGYNNINADLVEPFVDKALKEMKIA